MPYSNCIAITSGAVLTRSQFILTRDQTRRDSALALNLRWLFHVAWSSSWHRVHTLGALFVCEPISTSLPAPSGPANVVPPHRIPLLARRHRASPEACLNHVHQPLRGCYTEQRHLDLQIEQHISPARVSP